MLRGMFGWLVVALCAAPTVAQAGDVYGKGVPAGEITPVSRILDAPEDYLGKPVTVAGTVVQVCAKRGCWLELASDRAYEKLRIKVDDGVIVFPMSARGRSARVAGTLEAVTMSPEQYLAYQRHLAEERGEACDPAAVRGPGTFYQVRATGAVID